MAPYSYAGIVGRKTARGVVATLELTALPQIVHGHIAAWVGVGGVGLGPRGTNAWLQVGFAATESQESALYYEVARPRQTPSLIELGRDVAVGQGHRVGVIELQRRPGWWRVWIDGSAVTAPIYLASSHDRWAPVATSESWNGGVTSCNAFAYRFTNIRALPARSTWHPLLDAYAIETPGYSVQRGLAANMFVRGGSGSPPAEARVAQQAR